MGDSLGLKFGGEWGDGGCVPCYNISLCTDRLHDPSRLKIYGIRVPGFGFRGLLTRINVSEFRVSSVQAARQTVRG